MMQQMDFPTSVTHRTCCYFDTQFSLNIHSVLELCFKKERKNPLMILCLFIPLKTDGLSIRFLEGFLSPEMITAAVRSCVFHSVTLLSTTRVVFATKQPLEQFDG